LGDNIHETHLAARVLNNPPNATSSIALRQVYAYFLRLGYWRYMPKNKGTVLLVDDETGVRRTLAQILTSYGYNVLDAEDYYTALQIAEWHNFPN
jgi:PleD family two-component response regulator